MFFNLILILITVVLYYYRRVIFFKCLTFVLCICRWRIERRLKKMKPTLNKMTRKSSITIDNSNFTEYSVIMNEKEYDCILLSDFDVVEFEKYIGNNIDKRNLIVHAGITNDMGEILFDVTNNLY